MLFSLYSEPPYKLFILIGNVSFLPNTHHSDGGPLNVSGVLYFLSESATVGEHLNQSCHTTCIPVTSWRHPPGFCSSGHSSHSLYLAYSSCLLAPSVCFHTSNKSPSECLFFYNNTWISIALHWWCVHAGCLNSWLGIRGRDGCLMQCFFVLFF